MNKTLNYLYHYTTMDTLCSILNDYKSNMSKGNLTFWASSIFTMNDPREMLHGIDVLSKLLTALEFLFKISPNDRLNISNLDTDKVMHDYSITPFVLSFSQNEDDLSMWTMYGEKGYGVALLFDQKLELDYSECINSGLMKVCYDKEISNYQNLANIYNNGIMEWRGLQDEQKIRESKERILGKLFTQLCPQIKSEAYKNENEYRFYLSEVPYNMINFRVRNKIIIPYIKVQVPLKYLRGILLGPCCNADIAKDSLGFMLYCCKIENIPIIHSKLPYRIV